jgi:hypothetical protein
MIQLFGVSMLYYRGEFLKRIMNVFGLRSIGIFISLSFLLIPPIATAQSDPICEPLSETVRADLQKNCKNPENGFACTADGIAPLTEFSASGSLLAVLGVSGGGQTVILIPFGTVEINNLVEASTAEPVTFETTNGVGYDVNLREGAGTQHPVVGAFAWNATLIADGRNADGTWIRLQTEAGIAWASAELVKVDGDISQLPVLESLYTQPMQAFRFASEPICSASGVLIQSQGDAKAQIQINGFDLKLQAATLLVQGGDPLHIHILTGSFTWENQSFETGESVTLAADAEPVISPAYSLVAVIDAPLELLPESALVCVAGVRETISAAPSPNASPFVDLVPEAHYTVTASSLDENEVSWWRLTSAQGQAWIPQADVLTLGDCSVVAQIDLTAPVSGGGSGGVTGDPAAIIEAYLTARVASDAGTLQSLSCNAWRGQAGLQADSFRSMEARLEGMACTQDGGDEQTAFVTCAGKIITTYNGQTREWALGRYRLIQEGSGWRMCGEAN